MWAKFQLNFGSIFGFVVAGAGAAAVLYLLSNNGRFPALAIKMSILAAIGGATLGNWIWSLATPKEPDDFFRSFGQDLPGGGRMGE
jgi:hypothetical protein